MFHLTYCRSVLVFVCLCSSIAFFDCQQILATSAKSEKVRFDVPEGKATKTLKIAAQQSGIEFIFSASAVRGVRTQPIQGEFNPVEAFNFMLAGTSLAVFQHEKSGVYTIRNAAVAEDALGDSNPVSTTPMNENKRTIGSLFKGLLSLALASSPNLSAQEDDEVFELSPFSVNAGDDVGYRATTTLAGTRLNTQLRDLGASISVMTKELMEDTGSQDAGTLLSYGLNTEVGGTQGNFTSVEAGGDVELTQQRKRPQNSQRIRGLAEASLTRGYFLTDIPFDGYNTSSVTVSRGANALLFGIGSPGGVIDNGVKQASLGRNLGAVSVRLGERGSHRETIDLNRVLINDRLAIRFSALHEDTQYQQRPAFELDKRVYGAFEAVLLKNENSEVLGRTSLKGNFESGDISGTPPRVIPPQDAISSWFAAPSPEQLASMEAVTGSDLSKWKDPANFTSQYTMDPSPGGGNAGKFPAFSGNTYWINMPVVFSGPDVQTPGIGLPQAPTAGIQGRWLWQLQSQGAGATRSRADIFASKSFQTALNTGGSLPGFSAPVIMDRNVLDNENLLITGNTNRVRHDFDVQNLAFEQALFDGKAGLEFAYDKQDYKNTSFLPYSGNGQSSSSVAEVRIDMMTHHLNGQPNPNVGRPYIITSTVGDEFQNTSREAYRATAFYDLDFTSRSDKLGWLGRHIFTGFFGRQTISNLNTRSKLSWIDAPGSDTDIVGLSDLGYNAPGTAAELKSLRKPLTTGIAFSDRNSIHPHRRSVWVQTYIGDSLLGLNSPDQVSLTVPISSPIPQEGETYRMIYQTRKPSPDVNADGSVGSVGDFVASSALSSGGVHKQIVESQVLSLQSRLLNDNLVAIAGWRTDQNENYEAANVSPLFGYDGEWDISNTILSDTPTADETGDSSPSENTFTWSVVGHLPENLIELPGGARLSGHYSKSENFQPIATRRSILGENIPNPTGATEEKGFTVELFEQKLVMRVNWFRTALAYDTAPGLGVTRALGPLSNNWRNTRRSGVPFEDAAAYAISVSGLSEMPAGLDSYSAVINAIDNLMTPESKELLGIVIDESSDTVSVTNNQLISTLAATRSFVSEGLELDIVGNVTENWQLALNIGQQKSVQSDTATEAFALATEMRNRIDNSPLGLLGDDPDRSVFQTFSGRFLNETYNDLAAARAKDGTVSLEQREWRANLVTNYRFASDSTLKGFGVGGALRWQDEVATGYPFKIVEGAQIPDLENAFFDGSELNGDLWVSYQRLLKNDRRWKIQLNVRNAIGDNDPMTVITNPDGYVAVVRNPNPREVFLTNTFSF